MRDDREKQASPACNSAGETNYCCPASAETVEPYRTDCMVCGAALVYFETEHDCACHYCGQTRPANAACVNGHYVCDRCHSADAVEIIQSVCLHSQQTDPVSLMQTLRSHPHFHIHGPEHHAMLPAVILAALRNNGQAITNKQITTAIQRGQTIGGGACAFFGACGAAIGAGIAMSVLLGATPYLGEKRQSAQQATLAALARIASFDAPRCCQRDCWLALKETAALIHEYTGRRMDVRPFACEQFLKNKECIRAQCPLWPANQPG